MAEKRQRGLAEMWSLAAPNKKRKKHVSGIKVIFFSEVIGSVFIFLFCYRDMPVTNSFT